ncbi:putative transcriptional regulator, LuxR family [Gordonia polyisoprenivorans VH2]|uniref:Helix-turn-helix domain-containing protein n=2 Tax=Gordonia polyisoprenivorans TaxID=84595 RepID=A0A846WLN6_9ACTN|nr:putative transcriptional regulator, LuxR family [Gordonia polyisoprenivorans VH2]NKY02199.1 helix-turn-helix domain-containing protein [Gordonia polyisoprenivorans]OZC30349.1 LuxR family transcriptional regulator [Gordonia polyisoprenivorans]GAB23574.1 putative LuxR family transcriptional regulator [Gordonia polyisoprenivorans NBRC 16320 = JCM 10675]
MTRIQEDTMTAVVSHIPANQLAQAARRRAEADRRRTEALARLAARRMPLPGQQPMPANPLMRLVPEAPQPVEEAAAPELPRPSLTNREIEVLRTWLMVDSKPAVAQELFISLGTVNTHLTRIRAKYAEIGRTAPTKAALVARAVQDGLVRLDEL